VKGTVVILVVGCLLAAGGSEAFEGTIKVRQRGSIEAAEVRLGDVAELVGSASRFARVKLADRLAPGETRSLDGYEILKRLRAAGVDFGRIAYDVPATVAVSRRFQEISREAIERAIADYLRKSEREVEELAITRIEYAQPVRLPVGPYELVARGMSPARGQTLRRLVLRFTQQGRLVRELPAAVEISGFGRAYFVKRVVRRGEVISSSDLVARKTELRRVALGAVTDPEQAVGMAAVRQLSPDAPLRASDLAPAVSVRRGDPVTLVLETKAMRVTSRGTAREDGAVGKEIRVVNDSSGKELRGRVANGSVVVVGF